MRACTFLTPLCSTRDCRGPAARSPAPPPAASLPQRCSTARRSVSKNLQSRGPSWARLPSALLGPSPSPWLLLSISRPDTLGQGHLSGPQGECARGRGAEVVMPRTPGVWGRPCASRFLHCEMAKLAPTASQVPSNSGSVGVGDSKGYPEPPQPGPASLPHARTCGVGFPAPLAGRLLRAGRPLCPLLQAGPAVQAARTVGGQADPAERWSRRRPPRGQQPQPGPGARHRPRSRGKGPEAQQLPKPPSRAPSGPHRGRRASTHGAGLKGDPAVSAASDWPGQCGAAWKFDVKSVGGARARRRGRGRSLRPWGSSCGRDELTRAQVLPESED